jgi:hypothetical protein
MVSSFTRTVGTLLLCCCILAALPAGADAGQGTTTERPITSAQSIPEGPVLDGDVLDDPIWQPVSMTGDFWQTTPDDGVPASERTDVRIAYTDTTLYVGVVLHDSSPETVVAADSRRDSSMNDTDSFQIILDTFRDGQSGFVFGTNPAGVEYDGQVAAAGQGGGFGGGGGGGFQQGGAGGGFNLNWDATWEVRTQVGDFGWSAEFAIPFRTLRYRIGDDTWSINFQRNINRRNEMAFWSQLDRQYNLYRLIDAGSLTGIRVPIQRNLKISPYLLGATIDLSGQPRNDDYDVGADAKWSINPSLTLDLTVNTDFAQVEVDQQQINLDRFNLFFPEKRPFFLENAGLFQVGSPSNVELFFSRRIGIEGGSPAPIRGGGRLTGKVGGLNVGLLNMQTGAVGDTALANNFSVVRLSRDLRNRSSVGAIVTNRVATGDLAQSDDQGQTYGVDARFGIGQGGTVQGYLARTSTPGETAREHAYNVSGSWRNEEVNLNAGYTEVGDGFNPEVGFLRRSGYRNMQLGAFSTIRLNENKLGFLEFRPHSNYRAFWNFDGFQETGFWHIDNHWVWRTGHEVHTGMNVSREGVVGSFEISPGVVVPGGTYDHAEVQIRLSSNAAAPFSANSMVTRGGFFGGTRLRVNSSVTGRIGETFNATLQWDRNDIDLPGGSFITNLMATRVSYSFTPRIYTQALLQYNDRQDVWSTNLRFGWLQSANSGFFIVLNDTQDLLEQSTRTFGRSLVVKYSHLFDVFSG